MMEQTTIPRITRHSHDLKILPSLIKLKLQRSAPGLPHSYSDVPITRIWTLECFLKENFLISFHFSSLSLSLFFTVLLLLVVSFNGFLIFTLNMFDLISFKECHSSSHSRKSWEGLQGIEDSRSTPDSRILNNKCLRRSFPKNGNYPLLFTHIVILLAQVD